MKRQLLSILIALLCDFSLFAQSTQRVVVYEYKEKGSLSPLPNVEVVVNNAGSTVSDKQGYCTLNFRTLKPGDKVSIRRIEKPGFEIFNKEQFDSWFISRDPKDAFEIIMVNTKTLGNIRSKYEKAAYSVVGEEKVKREKQLEIDFQKGLVKEKEYNHKLQEIEEEYNKKLDDIDNYIEHFSRLDLSKVSAREKQIIDKLKKGDIDGAIADYESVGLVSLYRNASQSLSQLTNAQEQLNSAAKKSLERRNQLFGSVKNQFNLLVSIGGKENVTKARNEMREIVFADSTNYSALEYFANWSYRARYYDDSERAYSALKKSTDSIFYYKGVSGLASTYASRGLYERSYFEDQVEALEYFTRIAKEREDTTLFLEERTRCLSRILSFCSTAHFEKEGNNYIERAITLASRWNILNPGEASLRRLFDIYCYSSRIYSRLPKETYESLHLSCLEQAVKIASELYWQDQSKFGAVLAYAYSMKGNYYNYSITNIDIKKAGAEYSRAEQLYEDMYSRNPETYISYLITCYHNHGRLYRDNWNDSTYYDLSLKLMEKSRYYLDIQFKKSPTPRQKIQLGELYYSLALCHYKHGAYDKAKENLDKSNEIIAPQATKYPKTYNHIAARNNNLYSRYYLNSNHPDYTKAVEYLRLAVEQNPSSKEYKEQLDSALQKINEE